MASWGKNSVKKQDYKRNTQTGWSMHSHWCYFYYLTPSHSPCQNTYKKNSFVNLTAYTWKLSFALCHRQKPCLFCCWAVTFAFVKLPAASAGYRQIIFLSLFVLSVMQEIAVKRTGVWNNIFDLVPQIWIKYTWFPNSSNPCTSF